jgi:hypothetical protein
MMHMDDNLSHLSKISYPNLTLIFIYPYISLIDY